MGPIPIKLSEEMVSVETTSPVLLSPALFTQIAVHCELICAGVRLAAQVGCNRDDMPEAIHAITVHRCLFLVEENTEERVGIWIYKSPVARILIDGLRDIKPSRFSKVVAGKLFGYSDAEIGNFIQELYRIETPDREQTEQFG